MKRVVTLLLAASLLCIGTAWAAAVQVSDFNHDAHKTTVSDCKTCHHMGIGNGKCTGCHDRDSRALSWDQALQGLCQKCHADSAAKTEPAPTTSTRKWRR